MMRRRLPEFLYRVHLNRKNPLAETHVSGGYRFDDFRHAPHRRFHILYAGDSIEGSFIEKLQKFCGNDEEAATILNDVVQSDGDRPNRPARNSIPAKLLRDLAASKIAVLDPTQEVIDISAAETMIEIPQRDFNIGICIPDIQLADVMKTGYRISKRLSTIIHDTTDAAGLLTRSSLDDPTSQVAHLTYSLFRKLPTEGSKTRVLLDRKETKRALDGYCTELQAALTHLRAVPALPLDHPDLGIIS